MQKHGNMSCWNELDKTDNSALFETLRKTVASCDCGPWQLCWVAMHWAAFTTSSMVRLPPKSRHLPNFHTKRFCTISCHGIVAETEDLFFSSSVGLICFDQVAVLISGYKLPGRKLGWQKLVIGHVLSSCRMLSKFLVRFSKWLQSVKTGVINLFLCIAMAYNVFPCTEIIRNTQTEKITDFTM